MAIDPHTHNQEHLTETEKAEISITSELERPKARWAELQASIGRAPKTIENETTAEAFTTIIGQLQALKKRIDAAHDTAKEPWLEAGRRVDALSNVMWDAVDQAQQDMQAVLTAYQVAKQNKIRAEREALRAREAADPEPAAVDLRQQDRAKVKVRSVEGASANLVDQIGAEIVDVKKIPKRYLDRPKVIAAILAEILPDIRKGDVIAGAKRTETVKSRVKA